MLYLQCCFPQNVSFGSVYPDLQSAFHSPFVSYFLGLVLIHPGDFRQSVNLIKYIYLCEVKIASKFQLVLFLRRVLRKKKSPGNALVLIKHCACACFWRAAKLNVKWCCLYPMGEFVCTSNAIPTGSGAREEVKVTGCWGKKVWLGASTLDYTTSPHQRLTDLLCLSFRSRERYLLKVM